MMKILYKLENDIICFYVQRLNSDKYLVFQSFVPRNKKWNLAYVFYNYPKYGARLIDKVMIPNNLNNFEA